MLLPRTPVPAEVQPGPGMSPGGPGLSICRPAPSSPTPSVEQRSVSRDQAKSPPHTSSARTQGSPLPLRSSNSPEPRATSFPEITSRDNSPRNSPLRALGRLTNLRPSAPLNFRAGCRPPNSRWPHAAAAPARLRRHGTQHCSTRVQQPRQCHTLRQTAALSQSSYRGELRDAQARAQASFTAPVTPDSTDGGDERRRPEGAQQPALRRGSLSTGR